MSDLISATDRPEHVRDVLVAWDAGDIVTSVEMGGLGPGYEQAIQILAFEIIRDALAAYSGEGPYPIESARDSAVKRTSAMGYSGAQVGAASSIAAVFLKQGYRNGLRMVPADRLILVQKDFPRLEDSACAASPA